MHLARLLRDAGGIPRTETSAPNGTPAAGLDFENPDYAAEGRPRLLRLVRAILPIMTGSRAHG